MKMEYILEFPNNLSKYPANFSSLRANLKISVFRGTNYGSLSIFKNIFRFNILRCSTKLNFSRIEQLIRLDPLYGSIYEGSRRLPYDGTE